MTKEGNFGWRFEKSESGDIEGLNDGSIETFKEDHLLSLAKECAQNSLDAQLDLNKPVTLEFKTFYIDRKDFPDINSFQKIIEHQIKFWQMTRHDKSSEDFFKEMKKTLDAERIFCLRISDFNTTGLEGSKEGKNNHLSKWFKLVRSRGVTDNTPLAGGSFGLGKFASFACSKLRTVIYNTIDSKGAKSHQGVTILASYSPEEGIIHKGRGYFCNLDDFSCIDDQFQLDKSYKRDSTGTDIYIIGFMGKDKGLEDELFSSILRSFLLAIYNGNLIFNLNGTRLQKSSLNKFIDRYRNEKYGSLKLGETIQYYDLLEGNIESEEYKFSMMEDNDVSLRIAIGPGLCRRVGMFRNNGMKIFDKKGIKSYNDFVAMLCLQGNKVNAYFRKLENPQHDNWRSERSNDPESAENNINKLTLFITKNLKDLENKTLPESENIEGIDSLLDEEFEKQGQKPIEGLQFKPLEVRESKTKRPKQNKIRIPIKINVSPESEPGLEQEPESPESEPETRTPIPHKKEEKSLIGFIPKKINLYRDNTGDYHLIFMLPENSESLKCMIFASGEEINELLGIEKADLIKNGVKEELTVKANKIELRKVTKELTEHIIFKLKNDENLALEVKFYED